MMVNSTITSKTLKSPTSPVWMISWETEIGSRRSRARLWNRALKLSRAQGNFLLALMRRKEWSELSECGTRTSDWLELREIRKLSLLGRTWVNQGQTWISTQSSLRVQRSWMIHRLLWIHLELMWIHQLSLGIRCLKKKKLRNPKWRPGEGLRLRNLRRSKITWSERKTSTTHRRPLKKNGSESKELRRGRPFRRKGFWSTWTKLKPRLWTHRPQRETTTVLKVRKWRACISARARPGTLRWTLTTQNPRPLLLSRFLKITSLSSKQCQRRLIAG